jgi:hypothetical protein
MQWIYYYLLIPGFICIGAAFALVPVMTFVSIIVQTFLVYTLWAIMEIIKDPRPPEILINSACYRAILYFDALNLYGIPDSIMVPIFTYLPVFVYMFVRLERPGAAWFFGIVLGAAFIAYTVIEFVLGRIYIYQYFVNIAITVVFAVAICSLLHVFYDLDTEEQMRLLLKSMLSTLFAADRKIILQWVAAMVNKKRRALVQRKRTRNYSALSDRGDSDSDGDSDLESSDNAYELEELGSSSRSGRHGKHREGNRAPRAIANHWSLGVEGQTLHEARQLRAEALRDFADLIRKLDRNSEQESNATHTIPVDYSEQWIKKVYK